MPLFMVQCYEGGKWDGKDQRRIEAESALEAAEAVCGEPLAEGAKLGDLRAQVTSLQKPMQKVVFRRAGS